MKFLDPGVRAVITRVKAGTPVELEVEVRTTEATKVNGHRYDVFVERGDLRICAGFTIHDRKSVIIEGTKSWPYDIAPGLVVTDRAAITELDVKKALSELGPGSEPRYLVQVTVDVDGTPVPVKAEAYFTP